MDDIAAVVPQVTAQRIQDMIKSGVLPLGSRLPSQRELATQLDVSRASLREALSTLEALGLLRTEARRGTLVVGEPLEVAQWRFGSRGSAADFFQFRFLTEGYAARLAAMRSGSVDTSALRANLQAMTEALRRTDLVAVADLDGVFHKLIMAMSGNRVFLDLYSSYCSMARQSHALPLSNAERLWEPVMEHENVVRAIEQRDPAGASYFMHFHLIRAAERYGIVLQDAA